MRTILNILILLSISSLAIAQTPGIIVGDQSICYGSAPGILRFDTPASGGVEPYSYRWQRSNDGINFTDISGRGAGHEDFSPPVLANTAWFRCKVSDASVPAWVGFTNDVAITVSSNLNSGTIGNAQTVITGLTPITLSELYDRGASGGSGTLTYQWQSSVDGLYWSDIQGATSSDYAPVAITSDIWFRRFVIDGNCGSTASNAVKITAINTTGTTLFTTEIPTSPSWLGVINDLGTEFNVLSGGFITSVRLWSHISEQGVHQIRLWRQNDQSIYELIVGPIPWDFASGIAGWREFDLPSPVAVESGRNYIISVTNGADNFAYVYSSPFSPEATNSYIRYLNGLFSGIPGTVPRENYSESYFRDVVFIPFSPGSAGVSQSICYNSAPSPFVQVTAPTGGSGVFNFQWQNSPDGINWSNIPGATAPEYSPPALTITTYFRRVVTSSGLTTFGDPVLITVDSPFTLAELHDNISIYNNTSTNLNVVISGGTPPYSIEFTRNGFIQPIITNYTSGTDIYTGVLATGEYEYVLTSVRDAFGCEVQSHGNPVMVTVSGEYTGSGSNKALLIVNSYNTINYPYYLNFIKPYLDWFGVPYEVCDINTLPLPANLSDYALIIFGHRNVYLNTYPPGQQDYPIAALDAAVFGGVGLYSFDAHLFDFPGNFNVPGTTHPEVRSAQINILTDHTITKFHENDLYNFTNSVINIKDEVPITIFQCDYSLAGGIPLATMSDGVNTEPLLQVASYGSGRIVKWSSYYWTFDEYLGPLFMDDLIWRGLAWAARKPFVMQGMPPMITMRVDDVNGYGNSLGDPQDHMLMSDLEWLEISNEFGFVPWLGTFCDNLVSPNFYSKLRHLIDYGFATASPHSFSYEDEYIYYNNTGSPDFNAAANVLRARAVYESNSLQISKFFVPHAYLLTAAALPEIRNMGVEFIGTFLPCDPITYPGNWLNAGPYRINRDGFAGRSQTIFYGDYVGGEDWNNVELFNCMTEFHDDGGYEWYPTDDVASTVARGVRHLRRAINNMALPTLFTHEYFLRMSANEWRQILSGVTSAVSSYYATEYNLEYKSMDDAVQYVRAKKNIQISNVTSNNGLVSISCSGINDMSTKCYLFTESDDDISFKLITLPQVSSETVPVTLGVNIL